MSESANVDPRETAGFDRLASRWWDPEGEFRTLHDINGPRVDWILERAPVGDRDVLDVGCGGGLLSEALAAAGARVTGLDASARAVAVARMHLQESGLDIDYREGTVEPLARESPETFDVVCCLELLEHVPDPDSVVRACAALVRPGGAVFFSTINRSPLAWATAIVGAEYVLGLVPRGTHRYDRLIRPAELAAGARRAGLAVREIAGMHYNPVSRTVRMGGVPRVNYLVHAVRPQ